VRSSFFGYADDKVILIGSEAGEGITAQVEHPVTNFAHELGHFCPAKAEFRQQRGMHFAQDCAGMFFERLLRSPQHVQLIAFDVYFYQVGPPIPATKKIVQPDGAALHANSAGPIISGPANAICPLKPIFMEEMKRRSIGHDELMGFDDIPEAIEAHVLNQGLKAAGCWFKCMDPLPALPTHLPMTRV
jgi:hypothetical protein